MKRALRLVAGVLVWGGTAVCTGTVLWYNGDFDGVGAVGNQRGILPLPAAVYDNFVVPAPGWLVTAVFSNNLSNLASIAGADWEIRQGLAPGNGGTLIASGTGVPASWTPTGRSGLGYSEYQVKVDGLNVILAPGAYWLMVRPVGSGSDNGFLSSTSSLSTTSGANGVNALIDDDWFFHSTISNFNFVQKPGHEELDFSMGLEGGVVPEPATLGLAAAGLALVILGRRRVTA